MLKVLLPPLRYQTFKKRLGLYSYKVGTKHEFKKPGLVPLNIENTLKRKVKGNKGKILLATRQRDSELLYGKFTHGGFKYDKNLAPKLVIPDLRDFALKPYVSVHTDSKAFEALSQESTS
jgi:hypothetical protein